jgi:hypothetical protein
MQVSLLMNTITTQELTPLAEQRAWLTIKIVAEAVAKGELGLTYSDLARRLGMAKVNGQGLSQYLNRAAEICIGNGWPNVAVMVVSKESLEAGAPLPSKGSFSDGFYARTGLTEAEVPAEQARVRAYDWSTAELDRPEED